MEFNQNVIKPERSKTFKVQYIFNRLRDKTYLASRPLKYNVQQNSR